MLDAFGSSNEHIRTTVVVCFEVENINPLNVLELELESTLQACIISLASGWADIFFENDSQIIKREISAITLSTLAPYCSELL